MRKIDKLFNIQPRRVYGKDQIVLYQGSKTLDLYRIKSGYVAVTDSNADGDRKILMLLGPGDMFPLTWGGKENSKLRYFYETMTNCDLEVCEIKKLVFVSSQDHEISQSLQEILMSRLEATLTRLELVEKSSASTKLGYVFKFLAETLGKEVTTNVFKVNLPITHQVLADLSGVTRETVSVNIKELEECKAIVLNKTNFIVHLDGIEAIITS